MSGRPPRISIAVAAFSTAIGFGAITQAGAAPFTVTNTNGGGAGSLHQAVLDANASGGADTITFAPGVNGTIFAPPEITGPTTISGPGAAALTIDGGMTIGTTASATISGLTIKGGSVVAGNASPGSGIGGPGPDGGPGFGGDGVGGNATTNDIGGGAVVNHGELVLERVVVTGGRGTAGTAGPTTGTGGRGGNGGAGGAPTSGGRGGNGTGGTGSTGDIVGAGILNEGTMTIRASTVTGNSATAGDGGDATATGGAGGNGNGAGGVATGGRGGNGIANGVRGGSVRGAGIHNAGTMTIEGSTVTANTATAGSGGDARATGGAGGGGTPGFGGAGGTATATGGAGGDALGAGVYNAGTLELRNSTISGNTAVAGASPGTATQSNGANMPGNVPGGQATATAGRAGASGGAGLANVPAAGKGASLNSVTFASNSAANGANLSSTGTLSIVNSIVTNPHVGANCSGPLTSGGFNIDSGTSCAFNQAGDQQSTDPQLGLLQDNGGPTATQVPAQTGPAVDRGNAGALATDQRDLPRPSNFAAIAEPPGGDGSDIGAVELDAPLSVDLTTKRKQEGERLRVTVTCSDACDVVVAGAGKADGEKFKTKRTAASLAAGVATTLKVKLKRKARKLVTDARGKAKLTAAASAGGESATDGSKVKLKP